MATAGLVALIVLAAVAIVLSTLAARHGPATAFVRLCWVPLVAFILTLVCRTTLGLAVLAALIAVELAALGLVGVGIALSIRARRQGSRAASLIVATAVAGTPLLMLAAQLVSETLRKR